MQLRMAVGPVSVLHRCGPVSYTHLAELFQISEEDLLAGIALDDGAPEIQGFAIEGSTHADNMTASNSNATWGHLSLIHISVPWLQ